MDKNAMRIERRKLWEQMKGMLDTAETEKRKFTAEEEAKYAKIEADLDGLKAKIDGAEKDESRKAKIEEVAKEFEVRQTARVDVGEDRPTVKDEKYRNAFRSYLGLTSAQDTLPVEQRGVLLVGSDPGGGYTVPQEVNNTLIMIARNNFLMRNLSTVYTLSRAETLTFPKWASELGDVTFTAELLTGDEDTATPFAKVTLSPKPMARRARISKTLIRQSALNIESIIMDALGYSAGRVEENAFLNGSGANEPLGVFTASAQGIDTDRDVSTGNTSTSIQCDGLIEAKYTMHPSYLSRCKWIFHRDAHKQIRKLKDGEGQYIWRPGISGDKGDMILDIPALMSEYAPHTFTSTLYVGILGDFSKYYIVDSLGTTIQTLTELYAASNENGYILRKETDGAPVVDEAFVRVALA